MKIVCYHLRHSATGTTASAATVTVLRTGKIVGCQISGTGTGGAGIGVYSHTLEFNSVQANGDTNNPSREAILASIRLSFGNGVSGGAIGPFVPMANTCQPGDIFGLGVVQVGTACASAQTEANVYVQESA